MLELLPSLPPRKIGRAENAFGERRLGNLSSKAKLQGSTIGGMEHNLHIANFCIH